MASSLFSNHLGTPLYIIPILTADQSTDRLVSAMDLADDIRSQVEIASAKQQLWDQGLAPEGKENTAEASMTKMLLFELSTQMRDSRPGSKFTAPSHAGLEMFGYG